MSVGRWGLVVLVLSALLGCQGCKEEDDLYDFDGDGVVDAEDCEPEDADIYPGAEDLCYDGIDNDCDGLDCPEDADSDGYTTDDGDCNNNDPTVNPGVPEEPCDGVDNDCNEATADEPDLDGDGYSTCPGDEEDCDDADPDVNPGVEEVCDNQIDDNCSGTPDHCGFASPFDVADADAILSGEDEWSLAGWALAGSPDLTGDGGNDLLVGSPGGWVSGRVYVVDGTTTGPSDLSAAHSILLGDAPYDFTGEAVAVAEDVTGDGARDVLVGAPAWGGGEDGAYGAVFVVSDPAPGYTELGTEYTARITGDGEDDELGYSVSVAGDANGDGVEDLLVGVPDWGVDGEGVAYLFHGPLAGDLGPADAAADFHDSCGGSRVGTSVGPAGDQDGDGLDDFMIGAPYWEGMGGIFVVSGAATGSVVLSTMNVIATLENGETTLGYHLSTGDMDGDGTLDVFSNAWDPNDMAYGFLQRGPLVGTIDLLQSGHVTVEGHEEIPEGDDFSTDGSVAIVGDTQSNGVPDLLMGAPMDSAGTYAGAAYLLLDVEDGVVPLADGVQFVGRHDISYTGWAVAGLGDVTGDDRDDFAISAPAYSGAVDHQGEVYIFHGRPGI